MLAHGGENVLCAFSNCWNFKFKRKFVPRAQYVLHLSATHITIYYTLIMQICFRRYNTLNDFRLSKHLETKQTVKITTTETNHNNNNIGNDKRNISCSDEQQQQKVIKLLTTKKKKQLNKMQIHSV